MVARKNVYCKGEQQNTQTKFRDIIRWKARAGNVISVFKYSKQWTVMLEKYVKKPSEMSRWTCQCPLTQGEWSETRELTERGALSKLTSTFSHRRVCSQPSSAIITQLVDNYSARTGLVSHNMEGTTLGGWWWCKPHPHHVSKCSQPERCQWALGILLKEKIVTFRNRYTQVAYVKNIVIKCNVLNA